MSIPWEDKTKIEREDHTGNGKVDFGDHKVKRATESIEKILLY